ncbi:MAG: CinA family protein [Aeromicrobium sp.]
MTSSVSALDAVDALRMAGQTVATAESLTGGLLCAAFVDVPGASDVLRGAVVAYAPQTKIDVLGVDPDLVRRVGSVHPAVAAAMAGGVARVLGATWGVATTGVAGPEPSEGRPVGTVHVAVAGPDGVVTRDLSLQGDRRLVREQAVDAALSLLVGRLGESTAASRG